MEVSVPGLSLDRQKMPLWQIFVHSFSHLLHEQDHLVLIKNTIGFNSTTIWKLLKHFYIPVCDLKFLTVFSFVLILIERSMDCAALRWF